MKLGEVEVELCPSFWSNSFYDRSFTLEVSSIDELFFIRCSAKQKPFFVLWS